jgi:hypothetical protein
VLRPYRDWVEIVEKRGRGTGLNRERHGLGVGLLLVYHSKLAKWALGVYKLLIARKKVGNPSPT